MVHVLTVILLYFAKHFAKSTGSIQQITKKTSTLYVHKKLRLVLVYAWNTDWELIT